MLDRRHRMDCIHALKLKKIQEDNTGKVKVKQILLSARYCIVHFTDVKELDCFLVRWGQTRVETVLFVHNLPQQLQGQLRTALPQLTRA